MWVNGPKSIHQFMIQKLALQLSDQQIRFTNALGFHNYDGCIMSNWKFGKQLKDRQNGPCGIVP